MKRWLTRAVVAVIAAAFVTAGLMVAFERPAKAQGVFTYAFIERGSEIGVGVREATEADATTAGLDGPSGVVIESVRSGSPAEKAGFRSGDVVIEFDGERVRSVRQFSRMVQESPAGRPVRAVVARGATRETLEVVPENTLPDDVRERARAARERLRNFDFDFDILPEVRRRVTFGPTLGVTVSPLTDQLAEYFGVKEGVLVNSVESGSAAADAGIRAGDVITAIAGRTVRSAADISEELRRAQPGGSVDVSVTRDRKELTLKAVIPERNSGRSRGRGITL